jgi:hypothetical protein
MFSKESPAEIISRAKGNSSALITITSWANLLGASKMGTGRFIMRMDLASKDISPMTKE